MTPPPRPSSTRPSKAQHSAERSEERSPSRRRRRRGRSGQAKRRLLALAFGLVIFGLAGGLLALVAGELADGEAGEFAAEAAESALASPAVAMVTCPAAEQRAAHPAYAAACGDRVALRSLLARPGVSGDAPDPRPEFAGRSPLHHAAQRGDTTMVGDLLAAGADPNRSDAQGHTPLHLAAATLQLRHPEFVARRLIEAGARVDLRNARGRTPLEELETHHGRLLDQQNLAQLLFQVEREETLIRALAPVGSDEAPSAVAAPAEPALEAASRTRLDPPAAGPAR